MRTLPSYTPILLIMFAVVAFHSQASGQETIVRLLSPRARSLEREETHLRDRLERFPPITSGHFGDKFGYQSRFLATAHERVEIVIDLKRSYPIDLIALIPTETVMGGTIEGGYGFPQRFEIEISENPDFEPKYVVADHKDEDFENPGRFPYVLVLDGKPPSLDPSQPLRQALGVPSRIARYIRLTSLKHWERGQDLWTVSLSEIIVLSGPRNVALGADVTANSELSAMPTWGAVNLVDGQSSLGPPVNNVISRTNGYRSDPSVSPLAQKWVQIDLSVECPIDEIRIVPAQPIDWPRAGFGFPLQFRLEVSNDRHFHRSSILYETGSVDFPNPGDNTVAIPVDALGRYVRMTATRLFSSGVDASGQQQYVFALGEIQVYSADENMALGRWVTTSDFVSDPMGGWSKEYLTDGYSSQFQLINTRRWLEGLASRAILQNRLEEIVIDRARTREQVVSRVITWGTTVGILLIVLAGAVIVKYRRHRNRQVELLRRQIARDLHDDIGSNLGSIRLLSQMAMDAVDKSIPHKVPGTQESFSEDDSGVRMIQETGSDLHEINRIATETAESMRDIIWLIDTDNSRYSDLISQMHQVAERMLASVEYTFDMEHVPAGWKVPLEFRRHVLLAFKETLNNICRHANADSVAIVVRHSAHQFTFKVTDNGKGFDRERVQAGRGLGNLERRAKILNGSVRFSSSANGTTVEFDAKL